MEPKVLYNVLQARAGGAVERCHTVRHHGSYTVAEHSWGVAMLLLQLYPEQFPILVKYALIHDVPEGLTGDIPSTAKGEDGALDNAILESFELPLLSDFKHHPGWHLILKSCDRLDLYLWAREQVALGNVFANEIINNLEARFTSDDPGLDTTALNFFHMLKNRNIVPDRRNLLASIKETHGIKP
jgi:HD domain-containing protein